MQIQDYDLAANKWAAQKFNIELINVVHYHFGNCYDTITLKDYDSALKVSNQVNHMRVNGGWFDGMQLGYIKSGINGTFDVMC